MYIYICIYTQNYTDILPYPMTSHQNPSKSPFPLGVIRPKSCLSSQFPKKKVSPVPPLSQGPSHGIRILALGGSKRISLWIEKLVVGWLVGWLVAWLLACLFVSLLSSDWPVTNCYNGYALDYYPIQGLVSFLYNIWLRAITAQT